MLLNLIFLAGCIKENPDTKTIPTGQSIKSPEKNDNKSITAVEKSEQVTAPEKKVIQEQKANKTSKTDESKQEEKISYYDLKILEDDINQLVNITYNFTRDPSHPDYDRASHMKYYVIHTTAAKENFSDNANEFCSRYCAKNWNGWQYYINMSNYRTLFPLLDREDFSSEEKYMEYARDGIFINYTFIETSYDVENGKVLEYQLISWRLDNSFKYFEGGYDGTFLIYKIYCSPNMTILLTPRWEVYKMLLPSMTLEDSYKTWNNYIISERKSLLNKSNELLKRCSVNKEFFQNYEFPNYYKSEMLTGFWKVHYAKMFKLNSSLSAGAKLKNDGKLVLNQVNVSFTNIDEVDVWNAGIDNSINLKVEVKPDNEKWRDYYDHIVGRILEPGKSINRILEYLDQRDVEFSNNITIRATLYVEDNVELPHIEKTFTRETFIVG